MGCLQLGCITVEIFIIIGIVISKAAGGSCRGRELGVTQEELTVGWDIGGWELP